MNDVNLKTQPLAFIAALSMSLGMSLGMSLSLSMGLSVALSSAAAAQTPDASTDPGSQPREKTNAPRTLKLSPSTTSVTGGDPKNPAPAKSPTSGASSAPLVLTVRKAITMARSENPALRESQEKITQYQEQIVVTRATVFPNINLLSTVGYQKDAASSPAPRFGGDPYNLYNTDLNIKQPLFQIGLLSGIDSAKKDRDLRKLETAEVYRDTSNSVLSAFYNVTLLSRNVETLVRQQNIVRESLAVSQSRMRTGRGQLLDVLQVKTQIALLDPQISSAKDLLEAGVASLATLLGNVDQRSIQLKSELAVPALQDVDRSIDLNHANIPEIEHDRVAFEQVQDLKHVALGQNLPNLSLTADYIYNSTKKSDLFDDSSQSFQAGVLLTIPIFSGLSSIYQQRVFASQETQLEIDQVNLHNQFNLQQVTARKTLESAASSIQSGTLALDLALQTSNEAKRNYRLATIDFVQFLTVQQAYFQAEQALNLSKYNYIVALGNYFVASGQSLDTLIDLIERSPNL